MFSWLRRLIGQGSIDSLEPRPESKLPVPINHLLPEFNFKVRVSDSEVRCARPDGKEECVSWSELGAVIIETNDSGPGGTDVYWLLVGDGARSGCVIPQGADGEPELFERLQRIPGFDNEAVIEAMKCVENRRFLCWQKSAV